MQRFCKPQSSAQARKEAPIYSNVDRSIKVMSWFVKPPKRGQYPSINPNLCFGGENGYITQRYER